MKKIKLRMSNSAFPTIEVPNDMNELELTNRMNAGVWFTDEYGWKINPRHVVFLREEETDDD